LRGLVATVRARYRHFREQQDGQGLVEYGLILLLASVVAIAALTGLGVTIVTKLYGLATSF
jgi:Flp pilus assembly pilin Flp